MNNRSRYFLRSTFVRSYRDISSSSEEQQPEEEESTSPTEMAPPTPPPLPPSHDDYAALTWAIARLSHTLIPPVDLSDKPTFSGSPLEDPEAFLKDLDALITKATITDTIKFAAGCLSDEAAAWFKQREDLDLTYLQFKTDLVTEFNHPRILASIAGSYHGKRQQQGESVVQYLVTKQRQAKRLKRDAKNDIPAIIALMLPAMELHFVNHPTDLSTLRNKAIELEQKLKRTGALNSPTQTRPPKPESRTTQPQSSTNQPRSRTDQPQNRLPKCRFCPGHHWHRDCPTLRSRPGNA